MRWRIKFRQSNVVHMGDLFFNKNYPFIDISSGASIDGVIAATGKVLAESDDAARIIAGHGALASKTHGTVSSRRPDVDERLAKWSS